MLPIGWAVGIREMELQDTAADPTQQKSAAAKAAARKIRAEEAASSRWQVLAFAAIGGGLAALTFLSHANKMAGWLSEPQIIVRMPNKERPGEMEVCDDMREAYWWLRDNTPEDARVMAWWDYGYQINGVANRTTLADGNTWNHEHIALLGRALVLPEKPAHAIAKHLADYVLVWSTRYNGMFGDDLAKMPHMARIAGSVFDDIDPNEYYLDQERQPSAVMRKSLLFHLHSHRLDKTVRPLKHFTEAFTSKHRMVRVWKVEGVDEESRAYCDANRAYPPALKETLAMLKPFDQVKSEDPNDPRKARRRPVQQQQRQRRRRDDGDNDDDDDDDREAADKQEERGGSSDDGGDDDKEAAAATSMTPEEEEAARVQEELERMKLAGASRHAQASGDEMDEDDEAFE
eukprot:g4209.t1